MTIIRMARNIVSAPRTALGRFFYDSRSFDAISDEWWAVRGPADGRALHHWLIPQRTTWVPAGIRNAGFNLVELPGLRGVFHPTLDLNTWMGFAPRWGGVQAYQAGTVEWGIRLAIPGAVAGGAYAGWQVGSELSTEGR